jgi:hypothetical protein
MKTRLTPFGYLVVATISLVVGVGSALLATVHVWWPVMVAWARTVAR